MTDEKLLEIIKENMPEFMGTNFHDKKLRHKITEVKQFMFAAGVAESDITEETAGVVAIGVSDIFDSSSGDLHFSPYFFQRMTQLASKKTKKTEGATGNV